MFPSNQRFHANGAPGLQGNLWLVLQEEFTALQRMAQYGFHTKSFSYLLIQFLGIELHVVAPLLLGAVHCRVGVFQQCICVRTVDRIDAEADTAGNLQLAVVDQDRFGDAGEYSRHQQGNDRLVGVIDDYHEFVTALPGHRVVHPHA